MSAPSSEEPFTAEQEDPGEEARHSAPQCRTQEPLGWVGRVVVVGGNL